jgi:hypothetical protein
MRRLEGEPDVTPGRQVGDAGGGASHREVGAVVGPARGVAPAGWSPALNRRLVTQAIEAFGTDRCLFGSNFPIDGPVAD